MTSLFVLVPGFGAPHLDKKFDILQTNLNIIQKGNWSKLRIRVCCYDQNVISAIPQSLLLHSNIEWVFKKGIVGQFIHEFASPSCVNADYVLVILDDIELQSSIDWSKIFKIHKRFKFDIYAPCLTRDSEHHYKYMLQDENPYTLKIPSACEMFCYFMPFASYQKYYSTIDPQDNPWLWGEDLCIIRYNNLRVALLNQMTVRHYYKKEGYAIRPDILPNEGFDHVMRKYNTNPKELSEMKAIDYVIFET